MVSAAPTAAAEQPAFVPIFPPLEIRRRAEPGRPQEACLAEPSRQRARAWRLRAEEAATARPGAGTASAAASVASRAGRAPALAPAAAPRGRPRSRTRRPAAARTDPC